MNIREWTLPVYTILVQLAVGALLSLWIVRSFIRGRIGNEVLGRISKYPVLVVWFTILTAMIGAHFHLSRPLFSILSVLNFRTAWLSREITFNILFFYACTILCTIIWFQSGHERFKTIFGWITVSLGVTFVYCMARIYLLRTQPAWNTPLTIISFFLTTILLGVTSLALMMVLDIKFSEVRSQANLSIRQESLNGLLVWFTRVAIISGSLVIAITFVAITMLKGGGEEALTSLQLLLGLYKPMLLIRLAATVSGIALLVLTIILMLRQGKTANQILLPLFVSCVLVIYGEILGRILFYAISVRVGL